MLTRNPTKSHASPRKRMAGIGGVCDSRTIKNSLFTDMNFDPRGIDFVRLAITKARGNTAQLPEQHAYAAKRWGGRSTVAEIVSKSAIAGAGTGSGEWGAELADTQQVYAEFLDLVRPMTILGKLQGVRRVPRQTPFIAQSTGATAYWRGQGQAVPLSASAFDRARLTALSIACLQVFPNELLEDESPEAEAMILTDMVKAVADLSDLSFIDPSSAGTANKTPASVTYGAPSITSSGDVADDLETAIGSFSGSLETASWVLHPRLAVQMGLRAGGRGVAADLGARGGTLAGLPAITSENCAYDSDNGTIALIDAAGICLLDEGVETKRSNVSSVEMLNNPTGDSVTPTAATSIVNLWQAESTGVLVNRRINWRIGRAGSVVLVTGANYPGV